MHSAGQCSAPGCRGSPAPGCTAHRLRSSAWAPDPGRACPPGAAPRHAMPSSARTRRCLGSTPAPAARPLRLPAAAGCLRTGAWLRRMLLQAACAGAQGLHRMTQARELVSCSTGKGISQRVQHLTSSRQPHHRPSPLRPHRGTKGNAPSLTICTRGLTAPAAAMRGLMASFSAAMACSASAAPFLPWPPPEDSRPTCAGPKRECDAHRLLQLSGCCLPRLGRPALSLAVPCGQQIPLRWARRWSRWAQQGGQSGLSARLAPQTAQRSWPVWNAWPWPGAPRPRPAYGQYTGSP